MGKAIGHYVSGNSGTVTGPFSGTNINTLVGADTFYANGYTGSNVAIANIEAGHVWNGHETLSTTVQITNHARSLNEIDRHATWVGMILAGKQAGPDAGAYQEGMAPDAQLYSGALSAQWGGSPRYATGFSFFFSTWFDQYRKAFSTGMDDSGRVADVINSSIGGGDVTGTSTEALATDGLANANPRTLFVASAGNSGPGPNQVGAPASAYNNMSVGALGTDPNYNTPSSFSSGGPNNYADPVNGTIANARQVVDIAAPGQQQSSAYYGGETGGNGTTDNPLIGGSGPTGPPSGIAGGPNFYSRGIAGTSFSSPTVAGGAALLYDAAYSALAPDADARDARVIKAVLMNSADKTVGWNNGQIAHPNGQGGVLTTQGLDNRVGTGAMNLDAAYTQFLGGTTDVPGLGSGNMGQVDEVGWDFGQVVSGMTNDYFFETPLLAGSIFTATLTWFRDRSIDVENNVSDDSYDDLDLELWSVSDGSPPTLISESASAFNNSEHFSFPLPATGDYALRVRWFDEVFDLVEDEDLETYGLAWAVVPEPSTVVLMGMATAAVLFVAGRRRRTRRSAPSSV
ncbi:MAG: PEP-CTERM sorting domain-containing protein [Pirellulales bacterium]